MKTLNAKRIAAVAAGAALLGMGLASAGAVTFQNVPIISNSGQPVAQIVIGSTAKPSDGVAAANIAAAIGNLAYTSVPVTASVNQTQAKSVLSVQVSSSSYKLANQQVWLNVTGSTSYGSGTYLLTALIGSVLNRAVITGAPLQSKFMENAASNYAYTDTGPRTWDTTHSPTQSPYTDAGAIYSPTVPAATSNGGGITFNQNFVNSTSGNGDNIVQITSSNLPSLLNNYGQYSESESLWLTGMPVFNQSTSPKSMQLQIQSAGGAYEAFFGKMINKLSTTGAVNQAQIKLLGQPWTILNYYNLPTGTLATGTSLLPGGKIQLAESLTNMTTVYVGHNLTSGPFTVELTDLSQPNANGVSTASVDIFYNGGTTPTNVTQITPASAGGKIAVFNISGHNLYVNVNQTFAGLYAYQKWAKMQLYSNVWNVTSGQVFNQTSNPSWKTVLEWGNVSGTASGNINALGAIVLYASSPTGGGAAAVKNLNAGQSFSWVQSPSAWTATFVGDTLGKNYDPVQFSMQNNAGVGTSYQNPAGTSQTAHIYSFGNVSGTFVTLSKTQSVNTTALNASDEELYVTSSIPTAFQYAGQSAVNYVKWNLLPLELYSTNSVWTYNLPSSGSNMITNVVVTGTNVANFATSSKKVTITVYGTVNSVNGPTAQQASVYYDGSKAGWPTNTIFENITSVTLSRAVPNMGVEVFAQHISDAANELLMATLQPLGGPAVMYPNPGHYWQKITAATPTVTYAQPNQNLQSWTLKANAGGNNGVSGHHSQYFTLNMTEYPVPNSQSLQDNISIGLVNSTAGIAAEPLFQMNYSGVWGAGSDHGQSNNFTYASSQQVGTGSFTNAQAGFITERGTKIASVGPQSSTINFAESPDMLQILVAPSSNSITSKKYTLCGPYGIGQAVGPTCTGISNVTVAQVTANITVGAGANFTVSGIGNIKATPSVSSATTPVLLTNLSTTAPIAVLDSQANPSGNLILVGSGYVNTLSQQLQNAYNITLTPTSAPIAQGYGTNRILVAGYYANQTTTASNQFIQQLYAAASK